MVVYVLKVKTEAVIQIKIDTFVTVKTDRIVVCYLPQVQDRFNLFDDWFNHVSIVLKVPNIFAYQVLTVPFLEKINTGFSYFV